METFVRNTLNRMRLSRKFVDLHYPVGFCRNERHGSLVKVNVIVKWGADEQGHAQTITMQRLQSGVVLHEVSNISKVCEEELN
jgi:hypothetical protein